MLKPTIVIVEDLKKRYYNLDWKVWLDFENNLATFPLYGALTGRLLGYQQYNPNSKDKACNIPKNGRYYTYQNTKLSGEYACWGLDVVKFRDTLYITEGVFKSARLNGLGFDSISILSSNTNKELITNLYKYYNKIVWCGDNDFAGINSKILKYVDNSIIFDIDIDEIHNDNIIFDKLENK